jgi:mannose-6-phosphate isomerase-like protein (cupin superfamily)
MTDLDARDLVIPPGGGQGTWHLDTLWKWKVPAALTGGAFSLAEQLLPRGSAPPVHRHTREDEAWLVLDGELSFFLDDEEHRAGPGTCVYGPRGRAHTFLVRSEEARLLTLLSPGALEGFFHATGRPAAADTLPSPAPPDMAALVRAMTDHGVELVGPPPQLS